ncbi:beta-glucosidase-related glycosidase [Neocallimastix californiae]|uniref:beta-glucosidase n=1 Tax=Neocallimastix californiae TaxID=1754190 RepID=A0A1Y2AFB2_9FUNG|nr:beta-glucosidase-related glycosidase [Neocallimastix californiae]|eukprot:ORY20655.1 beta-glucosidase-related glycosidase [Neocallimastix californiae]
MRFFNIFLVSFFVFYLTLAIPVNDVNEGDSLNDYEINHINKLDDYLSECTVLLRKNGDFPLSDGEKQIYLYGNGVRKTIKGGTGSGEVNSRSFDTIEEAFTKGGFEILTKNYLDEYDKIYDKAKKDFKNKLQLDSIFHPISGLMANIGVVMPEPEYNISFPKEGDVALYVLSRVSGEGSDRKNEKGDLQLTDTEKRIITELASGYKKFMLVLNTGGPVDLSGLDSVQNILILSQLGVNTSKTLVDVISGNKYPSGKLTTTWTKFEDYPSIGDFGNNSDTNYKEGIYVGYRYFDTLDMEVMFPFGFGLGYTDFEYDIKLANLIGEEFSVEASVKNTGNFKGKEVLELYLSKPNTKLDEPYQILVNFSKSKELKPNEEDTIKMNFKLSDFASYDTQNETYVLEKGSYIVRLGNSSRDTKVCGEIQVNSRINVKKVKNKFGNPGFEDYVAESNRKSEDLIDVPKFVLDASSIQEKIATYDKKYEISEEVKALSKEDKAKLVIGSFNPNGGLTSVIGSASSTIAGAAGETAKVGNLKPIIMADGPAGLRLAKDYYVDKDGAHSTEGSIPASIKENFPDLIKFILNLITPKPSKNAKILHQYTTAIPIGTAIAQSWNREFAEVCGDVVGSEMEIFNVHLWLAPALNIHRNILCGRNYEYFSEDPLISGAFAASITNGVQKHKNAFVSIKHYAANNQETNRYLNSSNVSERAMREIYLKGFEICLNQSKPKSVMTSYNLINGVHTNESKELNSDILRNEFNFDGIVMTDWIVNMPSGGKNKYSYPTPYKVIQATGDIYMPGSKDDYKNILDALKKKNLSMEELEISATRIYKLAKEIENNI